MNIYINKYVYHTSSRSFALLLFPVPTTYTPSRLSKRLRHAGMGIDTHRNTCIGSRVYVYLERSLWAEEVQVGVKTVMAAARQR